MSDENEHILKTKADEGWQSYVPEVDELSWYAERNPSYSGAAPLDPNEAEAARRFVSNWLHEDNHGLRIPGSEWGRTLLNSLNVLMAHTGPYETHAELHARAEAQRAADIGKSFMVTLGFPERDDDLSEDAFELYPEELPFMVIYTENAEWVRGLPGGWLVDDPGPEGIVRELTFAVHELPEGVKRPTQKELNDQIPNSVEDELDGTRRFNALPADATEDELHDLVLARVRAWPGL